MEQRARLVVVNFLEPEPGDQDLHHDLPIRELLDYVARRRLRRYALLHRRSHLVLYEPQPASWPRGNCIVCACARASVPRHADARAQVVPRHGTRTARSTDGWFDLRPYVKHYGLPSGSTGMRVLDIGTWDGFWAFEMERRGAAEVVALDLDDEAELDWPPRAAPGRSSPTTLRGDGFRLAKELLGSKVERVNCNIYHATPEELGTFDLVFCGSVLIHLRDQLLALERIASLCTRHSSSSAEEYDKLAS